MASGIVHAAARYRKRESNLVRVDEAAVCGLRFGVIISFYN